MQNKIIWRVLIEESPREGVDWVNQTAYLYNTQTGEKKELRKRVDRWEVLMSAISPGGNISVYYYSVSCMGEREVDVTFYNTQTGKSIFSDSDCETSDIEFSMDGKYFFIENQQIKKPDGLFEYKKAARSCTTGKIVENVPAVSKLKVIPLNRLRID